MDSTRQGDQNLIAHVDENIDFLKELEDDFGDISDVDGNEQLLQEDIVDNIDSLSENLHQPGNNSDSQSPLDTVKQAIKDYKPVDISSVDFDTVDPPIISKFYLLQPTILELLNGETKTKELDKLLPILNDLTPLLRNDIGTVHKCTVLLYSTRFQELSSLVTSAVQYAKVVKILEQGNLTDEIEEEDYANISGKLEKDAQLNKEQTLVLMMSLRTSFNTECPSLTETRRGRRRRESLLKLCDIVVELDSLITKISDFVSSRVHLIAPNLCALLGAEITALLISHTGGITALSHIPTCNLASIGKRKHLSHELQNSTSTSMSMTGGIRQAGYIGQCELVQYQPVEFRKQMLRMLCAKVSLAARVDAGQQTLPTTSNDSHLGQIWKKEIETKISKLRAAPLLTSTKPLPVPEDRKRKKRAGRRYRKYREQFQLSYLRQLQNRVEFGKPEATIMDSFGEEIGLGMAGASLQRSASGVGRPVNNSAKMTKKMKRRLQQEEEQAEEFILSLEDNPGKRVS